MSPAALLAALVLAHFAAAQQSTPAPCVPSQWSAWTSCFDTTCKAGTESRTRTLATADIGRTDCGELSQTRCVTGDCFGQTYMTSSNGNFLLSVPQGGSMTFIEGPQTWTFSDVVNNAKTYTDSQVSAANTNAQTLTQAAQSNSFAYTDTQITALKNSQTAYSDSKTATAIATAKSYTDTQISQLQTTVIQTNAATTAQAIANLTTTTTTQIASVQNSVNTQITNSNNAQSAALTTQTTTLTTNINTVSVKADGIRTDLTTAQANIAALNTATNNAQTSANNAQSSVTALSNGLTPRVSAVETTTATHTATINNMTTTIAAQASTIAALNSMFGNLAWLTWQANKKLQCHLTGYGYSVLYGVCLPNNHFTLIRFFPDTRITPDSWVDLPGRSGTTFTKGSPNTWVQITFNDVIGIYSNGIQSWGCRWLLYVDNGQYNRVLSSHTDLAVGWRITPWTGQFYIQGLATGVHTIRFLVYRPYAPSCAYCLLGWSDGSVENSITVREINPNNMTFYQYFPDIRTSNPLFADIPNRQFSSNKQSNATDLWVYYEDNLGYYMTGDGPAAGWRLIYNGLSTQENRGYAIPSGGWYIMPMTLFWFLPNVPAGSVIFSLQNILYAGSSQTLQGWPDSDTNNAFVIEERARGNMAYVTGMSEQTVAGGWTSLQDRSVTHTKINSTSQIRVTYFDTIGFYGIAHAPACYWALIVDEGTSGATNAGTRLFYSHSSTGPGWRRNPMRQSYFPTVAPGTHTYRIQYQQQGGASSCSVGYPNGLANNYLIVEELELTVL